MTGANHERLTLLTGPVFPAGRYVVYDAEPDRAIAFLQALVPALGCDSWHVRIVDGIEDSDSIVIVNDNGEGGELTPQEVLDWRAGVYGEGHCEDLQPLNVAELLELHDGRDATVEELMAMIPPLVRGAHDVRLFSVHIEAHDRGLRIKICRESDLHIEVDDESCKESLVRCAAGAGLRWPPAGFNEMSLMDRVSFEFNVKNGKCAANELSSKDVSVVVT